MQFNNNSNRGRGRGRGRGNNNQFGNQPFTHSSPSSFGSFGGGPTTGSTSYPKDVRNQILQYVATRFNAQASLLSLSGSVNDPVLDFVRGRDYNDVRFCTKFFNAFSKDMTKNNVVSLDLSNNNIKTLAAVKDSLNQLTSVKNLCLSNNGLSTFHELDNIKSMQLNEIILSGNKLYQALDLNVLREVVARFPSIKMIDGQPVPDEYRVEAPPQQTQSTSISPNINVGLPPANPNSFFDAGAEPIMKQFIPKFFGLYDSNRQALAGAYTDTSTFTCSVAVGQWSEKPEPEFAKNEMGTSWISNSRNYKRMSSSKAKNLVAVGGSMIVGVFNALQQAQHDLSTMIVDSYILQVPNQTDVIVATIHGKYITPNNGRPLNRSFDRVMILIPAVPSSQQAGWPVSIINDQLHIRPFSELNLAQFAGQSGGFQQSPSTPQATPQFQQPQMQVQPPQQQQPQMPQLSPQQQSAIQQLQQHTKMTPYYCFLCLSETNWDLATAYNKFMTLRTTLPQTAFM